MNLIFSLVFLSTTFAKECKEEFLVFNEDYEKGLAPQGRFYAKNSHCFQLHHNLLFRKINSGKNLVAGSSD